jgi:hypothetical protein
MKTIPIYSENFKRGRTKISQRYAVRTVMPAEALRLSEDVVALKAAIGSLKSLLPDNIKKFPIDSVDERHDAEMDIWNEIHLLQKWLRNAQDQLRQRFLCDPKDVQ